MNISIHIEPKHLTCGNKFVCCDVCSTPIQPEFHLPSCHGLSIYTSRVFYQFTAGFGNYSCTYISNNQFVHLNSLWIPGILFLRRIKSLH